MSYAGSSTWTWIGDLEGRGLEFQLADAQSLPFVDGSFDAVLNVEASHC